MVKPPNKHPTPKVSKSWPSPIKGTNDARGKSEAEKTKRRPKQSQDSSMAKKHRRAEEQLL